MIDSQIDIHSTNRTISDDIDGEGGNVDILYMQQRQISNYERV